MKSVTQKTDTLRIAVAEGTLKATPETIAKLARNDLPKKDALETARVAGTFAAKKTAELIPFCHPVPVDHVEIRFEVLADRVRIEARVESVWKTGIEMEALCAVSVAALTLYDMLKPVEKSLEISSVRLLSKKGGKSDWKEEIPQGFKAAVLVTSDGTFAGKRKDKSGQVILDRLKDLGLSPSYEILPDEKEQIARRLSALCREGVSLIVTTGGTGLGPRDVTVEATREVIDREVPGIMEAARSFGQRRTPYAMLSRGLAGQKGKTLILNLPGSSKGTEESLLALFPHLIHAYKMMDGGGH